MSTADLVAFANRKAAALLVWEAREARQDVRCGRGYSVASHREAVCRRAIRLATAEAERLSDEVQALERRVAARADDDWFALTAELDARQDDLEHAERRLADLRKRAALIDRRRAE